ncbi:FAD:protein FMN transferase [Marinobacter sp. C2H3]|uniref:FAD:protein FMN transferase n=1 Tax=Marinobacter sp. C2H3 TaxID=3119003 RepID=UPI00300F1625
MSSRMIRPARAALASALFALVLAALAGCSFKPEKEIWEISGGIFGTTYHISVVMADDQDRLKALSEGIEKAMHDVDMAMSTYKPDSELSRFNSLADQTQWVPVSDALYTVLDKSLEVSRLTNGAFDITVGPLVNLWGFGPEARPEQVPDPNELAQRLAEVGYEKLHLRADPPAVRADSKLYLDLSAIAKGFGVDTVARYLEKEGIQDYLVEIGGEVRVHGNKPGGDAWHLAVEQPVEGARQVNRVVALTDHAMATSGDYRNYYESNGQRYSHTINPETGRPITHNLASVSVVADDCMTADALATGFNVMGWEKASELATRNNIPAYFIVREQDGFETHETPAFSSFVIQ